MDQLLSAQQHIVESDQVIEDDLYMFGDEVTIDGTVKGDVVAFGRVITLNGTVEGDFIAAGQSIVITGKVVDDARIAAQVIKIHKNAVIGDDLIAAAFSLEITEGCRIESNLVYAGYQALLNGDIGNDVKAGVANCEIAGHVGGDVDLSVDGDQAGGQAYAAGSSLPVSLPNVPAGLTISETARIDGELTYRSPDEANIASEANITGELTHELTQNQVQVQTPAEKAWSIFGEFATLLIIGLFVLLIAPAWMRRMTDNIKSRPLASLSLGVAGIVGFIILMLAALIGTIALAVIAGSIKLTGLIPVFVILGLAGSAMLAISFWFFTVYLAEIVFSVVAGRWLLGFTKTAISENRFLAFVVGLLPFTLLSNLPYVGTVVGWLAVLFGLGALVLWMFWKKRPEPTSVGKPKMANV
jgi:cytoskeletal protein CcmA (bactofilin family)